LRTNVLQITVEECLNSLIRRAQKAAEHQVFLVKIAKQRACNVQKIRIASSSGDRLAEGSQLQMNVANKLGWGNRAAGGVRRRSRACLKPGWGRVSHPKL
jgi:hypothetical protein